MAKAYVSFVDLPDGGVEVKPTFDENDEGKADSELTLAQKLALLMAQQVTEEWETIQEVIKESTFEVIKDTLQ